MKVFFGESKSGDLRQAVSGLSNPKLIIMFSNGKQFEQHVSELESLFPGVSSIGAIAMSYKSDVVENGVSVTAFTEGVSACANVLEEVSKRPAAYIDRLEKDIATIKPGRENVAMIDLCAGNDAVVLSSIGYLRRKHGIELMGGTGDAGKVSANGKVYEDACAYALIKNENGRVRAYKENIYVPVEGVRLVASKTDKSRYYIGELNGRSAKQVYMDLTNISESEIENQTFKNPLGKMIGDDICIISLKGVEGNGLTCYRQVNDSDILTLLEARDIHEVVRETIDRIKSDFGRVSAVFSVNCLFRYIMMQNMGITDSYLKQMCELGNHCGFVGYGEHANDQFINQTMTCMVFE